jgi:hypothetical protein
MTLICSTSPVLVTAARHWWAIPALKEPALRQHGGCGKTCTAPMADHGRCSRALHRRNRHLAMGQQRPGRRAGRGRSTAPFGFQGGRTVQAPSCESGCIGKRDEVLRWKNILYIFRRPGPAHDRLIIGGIRDKFTSAYRHRESAGRRRQGPAGDG